MNLEVMSKARALCNEVADKVKAIMLDELNRQLKSNLSNEERTRLVENFESEYRQALEHLEIIEMCIKCVAE